MLNRIILLLCLVFSVLSIQAQTPKNINIDTAEKNAELLAPRMSCDNQFAGTIASITAIAAQSNDIGLDTVYLCMNDSADVVHNHDADLSDDISPTTAPGIAYLFYDCPPTVMGPNLAAIQGDPCTNKTSPIFINGNLVAQNQGIWVASGLINGDMELKNDGTLIDAFGGGNPVAFYFAPMTIDNFALLAFDEDPVTMEPGPCVNVNTNVAFKTVYLTEIAATNISNNQGADYCDGSFRIGGGLPAYDPTKTYSISIEMKNNAGVTGSVTSGNATDGSTVMFTVPEPGTYVITLEDGKSCGATFEMEMLACNGFSIIPSQIVGANGDRVCVDFVVNGFVDINSTQYTIEFDPAILDYDGVENFNPSMTNLGASSFGDLSAQGLITVSWNANPNQGISLPDGSVMFSICFIITGQNGDISPVFVTGDNVNGADIEVFNSLGEMVGLDDSNQGQVFVSNFSLLSQYQIDTSCTNAQTGGFEVTAIGTDPPFNVTYRNLTSGGPTQGPFVLNSSGDTYATGILSASDMIEVTITDNSIPSEMLIDTIIIPSRPSFTGSVQQLAPILCPNDSTGVLRITAQSGGVPIDPDDLTYSWSNGETTSIISNLTTGLYLVTAIDQYNCPFSSNGSLTDPDDIRLNNIVISPASCSGETDGGLSIGSVSGGTSSSGNYHIEISGPNSYSYDQIQNSVTVAGVRDGNYNVLITDDNNCTFDTVIRITALKALSFDVVTFDSVSCNGGTDGLISVNGVTTGAPAATPYNFDWTPVALVTVNSTMTSTTASDLRAGTYQLIITDTDGCMIDSIFVINEPDSVNISLVNVTAESCIPANDGSITVSVNGGTLTSADYSYNWGVPGQTSSTASGLTSGNYFLTAMDDNSCIDTMTIFVGSPSYPFITAFDDDNLNCSTDNNGQLTVTPLDTVFTIDDIAWSVGGNGPNLYTLDNLSAGEYIVTVTSSSGCSVVDTAYVIAPDAIVVDTVLVNKETCPGDGNAAALVVVSGGTTPYTFYWSTSPLIPETQPVLQNLTAGQYWVRIEDDNNCTHTQVFDIEATPAIIPNLMITDTVSCYQSTCDGGATALASYSDGANGLFDFTWSSGESDVMVAQSSASSLCQGLQVVTVTDGTCTVIDTISIPSRAPISIQVMGTPVSCFGLSDGAATVSAMGGEGPYTYSWDNGTTGTTVSGLPVDTLIVTAMDANSCSFSSSVIITQPDVFMVDIEQANTNDVICSGQSTGQISIESTGGNAGTMIFNWSNNVAPSGSSIASDLPAGFYSVTVTDSRGCIDSIDHVLSEPPAITFSLDSILPVQCFGLPAIFRLTNISGGNGGPYTYSIDGAPEQDANVVSNLFANDYDISIFDGMRCATDTAITITQPGPVIVNLGPDIEVELGDSSRLVANFAAGGIPINMDSIFWSPSDYLSCDRCVPTIVTPLTSQLYTLTVYDENGCMGTDDIFVDVDKNRNVYLPNVFSPNGDGSNDEFRVFTGAGVTNIKYVRIFDRWGGVVFEETDVQPNRNGDGAITWDGFVNGKIVDSGVFVYLVEVEFQDGIVLLYRGDVTVLRR